MVLLLWIIGGVITFILICVILGLSLYVYSEAEKRHPEKKIVPANTSSAEPAGEKPDPLGAKFLWNLLILIFGGMLIYWVSHTGIGATDIKEFGWNNWLPILVSSGMISGFIALNAINPVRKILLKILATILFLMFVIIPIGSCITSPSREISTSQEKQERRVEQTRIPLTSEPHENWIKLVLPPGGKSEHIPVPLYMHIVTDGYNHLIHNVYRDGHECISRKEECTDGDVPSIYISNDLEKENTVYYMYVPQR